MKKLFTTLFSMLMVLCMTFSAFAGSWKQDAKGWWYVNDDGTYPTSCWQCIDTKDYYFGSDGYLLVNCVTPDGFTVDANGAKVAGTQANATAGKQETKSTSSASAVTSVSSEVYITATGKKYHSKPNCGQTDTSKVRKATLEEAKAQGLEPCKRCH